MELLGQVQGEKKFSQRLGERQDGARVGRESAGEVSKGLKKEWVLLLLGVKDKMFPLKDGKQNDGWGQHRPWEGSGGLKIGGEA